jgi:5-formyltetrahydrofolate cyclo-ligase
MKLKVLSKKQISKIQLNRFVLKPKLRKKILKLREKINKKNIQIDFYKIIKILKKEKINKKIIGGYYPVNFEIDDLALLRKFEKDRFSISLPVIKRNFQMDFYKWSFTDPLKVNKYGIPEPETKNIVYPDIILIPIVAFDKNLNRLGYGGGYYDRLIKKFSKKKKILKIGLACSDQKIDKVPVNVHDQKLDYIVTNKYIVE